MNDAHTYLGGIFTSRVSNEIRCQVRVQMSIGAARKYIYDQMPPVAGAKKFQAAPIPRVHLAAAKADDRIRLLRVIDNEVSVRPKKEQRTSQNQKNKNNDDSSHDERAQAT